MFLDAGTYQSSLRVLMQTQKWCEKKAPWKLSQEGCHQVPAGGVRPVQEGAKELSLPPHTTLRPCREEQAGGKMPTPSGAPAGHCPVPPVLGHSLLGTLPKAEQILDAHFQPKAFLY